MSFIFCNIFRLACSESVQYFQFDKEGNLYVYQPGAGCSGPRVRVEPGFEIKDVTQISGLNESSIQDEREVLKTQVSEQVSLSSSNVIEPTPVKRSVCV